MSKTGDRSWRNFGTTLRHNASHGGDIFFRPLASLAFLCFTLLTRTVSLAQGHTHTHNIRGKAAQKTYC